VDASDGVSLTAAVAAGMTSVTLRTPAGAYGPVTLGLRGRHQVQNALVAVRLLEALSDKGMTVPAPAVERGLRDANWPGRLDWRSLADGRRVLLDAAHNEAGAASLADYVRETVPGGRQPLVFGAVRDKDHAGMLRHLLPCSTLVVVTIPPTPRAADPDALRAVALAIDPGARVVVERNPAAPWTPPGLRRRRSPWPGRSSSSAPCSRFSKAAAGHGNLRIDERAPRTGAVAGAGSPAGRLQRARAAGGRPGHPRRGFGAQWQIERIGESHWKLTGDVEIEIEKDVTRLFADEVEIFTDRDLMLARATSP